MWNDALSPEFAFAGGCLVMLEFYTGKHYFHYPLSISGNVEEEEAALDEIEKHCRDNNMRLHFTNVPENRLMLLLKRYGTECAVNNRRRWRDYLYNTEDFKTYAGKRYSGQRNHVNKFKKLYTGWKFEKYEPAHEAALLQFLKEYGERQREKDLFLAKEEMDETLDLIPRMQKMGIVAGLLTVDGKIVGFSAGEVCGDMLVVHIEKASRNYEGAYPMLAQQFALAFCPNGVSYINRMDDAGDGGLRKSKLQYLPCEIVSKYNVLPKRAIDGISHLPKIETERLVLRAVEDEDVNVYARLASDRERNRWWGYDWRVDYPEGEPAPEYFLELAREDFRRKDEMPLGVYLDDKLIGEAVLHRFGYRCEVELGVRLLPEAEGHGYASEAMSGMANYAFLKLGLEHADAKCFLENVKSDKMLRAAGFRYSHSDEIYHYYYKTPAM